MRTCTLSEFDRPAAGGRRLLGSARPPRGARAHSGGSHPCRDFAPLLLIHGLTDDNVYFQHTLQLANALYMAGKPYELMPMLGTHMVNDPLVRLRQQSRILGFFNRELRPD